MSVIEFGQQESWLCKKYIECLVHECFQANLLVPARLMNGTVFCLRNQPPEALMVGYSNMCTIYTTQHFWKTCEAHFLGK